MIPPAVIVSLARKISPASPVALMAARRRVGADPTVGVSSATGAPKAPSRVVKVKAVAPLKLWPDTSRSAEPSETVYVSAKASGPLGVTVTVWPLVLIAAGTGLPPANS